MRRGWGRWTGWTLSLSPVVLIGCAGGAPEIARPADPKTAEAARTITVTNPSRTQESVTISEAGAEGAPRVVFKVNPGADASGVITGFASPDKPFNVTFNTCASTDPDNDPLLFSIDMNGDGVLDDQGTNGGNCRETVPYTAEAGEVRRVRPTVCVVDLDAAGLPRRERTCKTYLVDVYGPHVNLPPCPINSGWLATGSLSTTATCTCSSNGQVVDLIATYVPVCFASGGGVASWTVGGSCSCI